MLVYATMEAGGRAGEGNAVSYMRRRVRAINWKGRMEWIPVSGCFPPLVCSSRRGRWLAVGNFHARREGLCDTE